MSALQAGAYAPDFTLPGVIAGAERDFTLSAERGHAVVLAFYPGDDTAVCTKQLCSYQDGLGELSALDAVLWGISRQDLASHQRFAAKRSLQFPLLVDGDGAVARSYGLGGLLPRRAAFVIDGKGDVAWARVSSLGLSYPDVAEIAAVLRDLRPGDVRTVAAPDQ